MMDLILIPVRLAATLPPINAAQLPDGRRGATIRSLCQMVDIAPNMQLVRIRRNPKLAQALITMQVQTPGGPQQVEILLNWAISIWAAGLSIARLPEAKRAAALLLQQEAFAAIERTFAQFDNPAPVSEAPPPPSPPSAPLSIWQEGHLFLDHLEAAYVDQQEINRQSQRERQELSNRLGTVEEKLQALLERERLLEGGPPSPPLLASSPQRLAHIYLLARRIRAKQGYRIADLLTGLADHFHIEDISDLPESAWPDILTWFTSLLEE